MGSEMNSITYGENNIAIVCLPGSPLPELSFALEFASNNFCGRGVYRWDIERDKGESGAAIVNLVSLMPDDKKRPLQISQVAQLGGAVEQGIIPAKLQPTESFRFDKENPRLAKDGQNRQKKLFNFTSKEEGWAESIIESHDLSLYTTLATFSYGFGDMIVGLFALGVRHLKYQITQKTCQLWIKHKLTDEQIVRYFLDQKDYNIGMPVEKLP